MRNLFDITWSVLLSVLLIIFVLLSMNIFLPLKWRFPSWKLSPHLTSVKTNTKYGVRTNYVTKNGVLTVALDKNYATVLKTFDSKGNCILEQYFDSHGKPAIAITGNSAIRWVFNAKGERVLSIYLDPHLNPVVGKNGYALIRTTFDKQGKKETRMYYDADGLPTLCSYKTYGVRYEYNENKQISVITHLDANGNAMPCIEHYAICRKTYTPEGKLYMELFYDENGIPVQLNNGQYGYIYENGRPVCIDKDGHRMFVLQHILLHSIASVLLIGTILLLMIMLSDMAWTRILLLLYLAFIAYMTIINREAGIGSITWRIPPNYYLFFTDREILSNIWLFIPLGAILYKLSHMWESMSIPIALSMIIEVMQLVLDIGAFQLSDLIANSLGGVIGIIVCYSLEPLVSKAISKVSKSLPRCSEFK